MSKKESVVTIARNQWNDTENRRRALERDPNLEPGNNNMYCVPKIGTQQYQEIEILANALRKAVGEKEKPLRKLNQIDATGPLVQEVQSGTGTRRMRGGADKRDSAWDEAKKIWNTQQGNDNKQVCTPAAGNAKKELVASDGWLAIQQITKNKGTFVSEEDKKLRNNAKRKVRRAELAAQKKEKNSGYFQLFLYF